jgi:hypothetical protein
MAEGDVVTETHLLWQDRDSEGSVGELRRAIVSDVDVLALLRVNGSGFEVETGSARALRDALNLLLVDDGGSAEGHTANTVEGTHALHQTHHTVLEQRARRLGEQCNERAAALSKLGEQARRIELAELTGESAFERTAELVRLLAVAQQQTNALIGDLLSAIAGEP